MPSACHGQGNQVCGPLPLHLSEAPRWRPLLRAQSICFLCVCSEGDRELRKAAAGCWALISAGFPAGSASPNHHPMSGRKRVTAKVQENCPGFNSEWPW